MPVEEELSQISPPKDMLLTIGVFDGVHLGHQYLISQLKKQAKDWGLLSGVVTFRQHPQEVLAPQTNLPLLTTLDQKINLIKDEGVEVVVPLSFDRELARLSPRQFIDLLKKYLRMQGLVIGPDFALGRHRAGDIGALRALGQDMGFPVTVVSPVVIGGEVVSSTTIRGALAEGNMGKVRNMAGRYFSLSALVVTGAGRGLAFPTANLDIDPKQALPSDGVYATWAYINDKGYQSMTNVGTNPTFGSNQRTVEVYILDYNGDLYGHGLRVDVVERLRDERKFSTKQELEKQIMEDIKRGRAILNSRGRG